MSDAKSQDARKDKQEAINRGEKGGERMGMKSPRVGGCRGKQGRASSGEQDGEARPALQP